MKIFESNFGKNEMKSLIQIESENAEKYKIILTCGFKQLNSIFTSGRLTVDIEDVNDGRGISYISNLLLPNMIRNHVELLHYGLVQ